MNSSIKSLTDILNIEYPIIMAPMFLVTDTKMVIEASKCGITGAIPALNFRTTDDLRRGVEEMKAQCKGPFGINLIVNKSNFYYKEQLDICCDLGVDYFITSLGSPRETIEKAHAKGIKVFCDVTDLQYAKKVESLGADAIIAVNSEAGGHAGKISRLELIKLLGQNCKVPIISAGGVATHEQLKETLAAGAAGVSIGSIFIASEESPVSQEYKQACVNYGAKDVVMTTKISGTPCTVINTPYVEKIGTQQNWLERILNKNKRLKKWFKALTFYKGMKKLRESAFSATYNTVWCAGPTIEYVHQIKPISKIVESLVLPDSNE